MPTLYALPLFATSLACAAFGTLVLMRGSGNALTRRFWQLAMSVALWCFGYGMLYTSVSEAPALFWARVAFVGVVFIPSSTYHFVNEFLGNDRASFLPGFYILSVSFLLSLWTPYFFEGAYKFFWGFYPKAGPLYAFFIAYFYSCFIACVYTLAKVYIAARRKGTETILLNQVKYVFLAFCVASLSISDYVPNYGIEVYPFAYLAAAGWLTIMAYGTLRYRVLDINIIIRKTLTYSAVMTLFAAIYLISVSAAAHVLEGFAGFQTAFSSVLVACLITFFFQPLRKRIQAFVDGKFFRQYVDREEKLYELSREVITHTTTDAMAQALMRVLVDTLHPKCGVLYVRSKGEGGFSAVSPWGNSDFPKHMAEDNPLTNYFRDHPQPFVQDSPDHLGSSRETRNARENTRMNAERP
jgi:hypothetical protein